MRDFSFYFSLIRFIIIVTIFTTTSLLYDRVRNTFELTTPLSVVEMSEVSFSHPVNQNADVYTFLEQFLGCVIDV